MNEHGPLRRVDEESKKKELIGLLLSVGVKKHHDGRQLYELSLMELQNKFRKVGKYE